MKKFIKPGFILASCFLFFSCATIVGGSHYNAHVVVLNRPQAKIYYNGLEKGNGYASFKVKRKDANKVSLLIIEEGHEDQTFNYNSRTLRGGAFAGTILFCTGLINGIPIPWGFAVDIATGALLKPYTHNTGVTKIDYKNFSYIINSVPPPAIAYVDTDMIQMEDVLYLNNGSIVRGKIVEYAANYQVKIQVKGGSIRVYREDEIEKITKEPIDGKF